MRKQNPIELTGIYLEDDNRMITGYFSQFPEAVSQGGSIEEVEQKLFEILPDVLELKDRMSEEELYEVNVTKKSYSFQPAG